eukprot:5911230-Pleurochrysis_carterae.AAC.1
MRGRRCTRAVLPLRWHDCARAHDCSLALVHVDRTVAVRGREQVHARVRKRAWTRAHAEMRVPVRRSSVEVKLSIWCCTIF